MSLPTITTLEELVPELARLANYPKSDQKQIDNFLNLIQNAVRLWIIEQSFYDFNSDFFVEIDQEWFDCITWIDKLWTKIPDVQNKKLEDLLLGEYPLFYQQKWQEQIIARYQLSSENLQQILSSYIFKVTQRTLRNNFKRLAQLNQPKLIKSASLKGHYKKVVSSSLNSLDNSNLIKHNNDIITENNWLSFLNDGLSTIAELLTTKINGHQRFFIQAEYIVPEALQDKVADWADNLKEFWKQSLISPIKIKYYSASKNTTNYYIIYPVSIHYSQRAYYLYAFGETPDQNSSQALQWYGYRLERILSLKQIAWDFSDLTKQLRSQIHKNDKINHLYSPDYIQEQLELAYGFSFYREFNTMLLRFDQDYYQRHIKNTIRHSTFQKIENIQEVKKMIIEQIDSEIDNTQKIQREKLLATVNCASEDVYYKLCYRVGDHNVIMRLRSWGPNVEVILPSDLRAQIKEYLEKNYKLYQ
jgi:CRISPR-associated protein (TIGR03985 family)